MNEIHGWEMVSSGAPLAPATRPLPALGADDVLVRVAGCGVCHTDLGFWHDGVATRRVPPLILGHEISGHVVASGERHRLMVGRAVIVPAVIPCGECEACRAGFSTICPRQIMPGNDVDGGFADHLVVPGRGLAVVPGAGEDPSSELNGVPYLDLRRLAVIADAVSTPFQAIRRSGLERGELAIIVGLGGVGGFAAQIAHHLGAVVVGLDLDEKKLAARLDLGLSPAAMSGKELKARIRALAKERGCPETRWKIFECSGSAAGQSTAFSLLVHGATLMVVGFTMATVELRLSNLMAFDARALGNWGCAPELYPEIVDLVLAGGVDVVSTTELRPLAEIATAFDDVAAKRSSRRIVLVPEVAE